MDATPNVAGMDYFHLCLFVKALRTLDLSINSQNCWVSFDPNHKVIKKKPPALGALASAILGSGRGNAARLCRAVVLEFLILHHKKLKKKKKRQLKSKFKS